jgi:hypothetical protein
VYFSKEVPTFWNLQVDFYPEESGNRYLSTFPCLGHPHTVAGKNNRYYGIVTFSPKVLILVYVIHPLEYGTMKWFRVVIVLYRLVFERFKYWSSNWLL